MCFKQIVFVRVKGRDKNALREALKGMVKWNCHSVRDSIKEKMLTCEGKSIYNNGVIIRSETDDRFNIEIVTSKPATVCLATHKTSFEQSDNFIGYTFEPSVSYTDPSSFFEMLGYKEMSCMEFKDVECFENLLMGLSLYIYPKNQYVQLVETWNEKPSLPHSAINRILLQFKEYFVNSTQITLLTDKMKPEDLFC